jgi:hypothetical protein
LYGWCIILKGHKNLKSYKINLISSSFSVYTLQQNIVLLFSVIQFFSSFVVCLCSQILFNNKGIPILAKGIAVEIPSVFHARIGTESPVPKAFAITKKSIYWKLLFL